MLDAGGCQMAVIIGVMSRFANTNRKFTKGGHSLVTQDVTTGSSLEKSVSNGL